MSESAEPPFNHPAALPDLAVEVEFDPHVNFAMHQNDVPVIKEIRLVNRGSGPATDVEIRAWIDTDLSSPWTRRIALVAPGGTCRIADIDLRLNATVLASQGERQRATLSVEASVAGECVTTWAEDVHALAFNEWPGVQSLPELMAAFVLPNHPVVQQVLEAASRHLVRRTGRASLSGYQSGEAQVREIVASIYEAVCELDLGYITPPASYEQSGQKVRLPDDILENRLGTCLDLALLMAACFEQAGLNPLIVMTEGHAFAGVWTTDNTFADPAVDDLLRVRKRVQLGEIIALEATVVTHRPPPSVRDAQHAAARNLRDTHAFVCAIDIRCARSMSIRPLPIRAAGRIEIVEVAPPPLPASSTAALTPGEPAAAPRESPADLPGDETSATRLDRWKRRLLDLSLRNRVLNFRETRKSVRLLTPDLGAMEDALADGDQFTILPRPSVMDEGQPRSADLHEQRTGEDATEKFLEAALQRRRLHADCPERDLERRLVDLYRAARAAVEESGVGTLYLAVGFLSWYEADGSDVERRAPILLVPVELERETARAKFALSQADEEARINVTLLEKLRTEFGLDAPGLDELTADESGLDVPLILNRFRQLIKDVARWDVVEEVQLGLFSFTKFLMWRDLEDRSASLMNNRVVRYLVERPNEPFETGTSFPDPATLDAERSPAKTYCPKNADSSQLAAVYAAADGRTFVLEGPPGTGKSQTITNLIAQCLGEGKRVLFVSEKMAALNVVRRRLGDIGLQPFCLELHSHKASKREVLNQLGEALQVAGQAPPHGWERHARQLMEARAALNTVVEVLHAKRPIGLSVYQVTSRLIGLRDAPTLELRLDRPAEIRQQALAELREAVDRLAAAATTTGPPAAHPLRAIGVREMRSSLRENVLTLAGKLAAGRNAAADALAALLDELQMPGDARPSQAGLDWLVSLGQTLSEQTRCPDSLLQDGGWDDRRAQLAEAIALGRQRDTDRAALLDRYQKELLDEDLVGLRGRLHAAMQKWFLPKWLGSRSVRGRVALFMREGKAPAGERLLGDLDKLLAVRRASDQLADSNGPGAVAFGPTWRGGEADWDALGRCIDWVDRVVGLLRRIPDELAAPGLYDKLVALALDASGVFPSGTGPRAVDHLSAAWSDLKHVMAAATGELQLDQARAWGEAPDAGVLERIQATSEGWESGIAQLNDWCYWQRVRAEAAAAGLKPLLDAHEAGAVEPEQFRRALDATLLRQWLDAVTDNEPVLRQFNGSEHQQRIERFRELDEAYLELSREYLAARLAASVPQQYGKSNANSEMGILQRQLRLQRRHMPVRKLMERLPNLLPLLKPCLLMSPLSVAQYLDTDFPPFDVVVFDEASQIPVWDAVGAIARGAEAVVVGDSKQLPPTTFFSKVSDEEPADEDDIEELESVLEECLASSIPAMQLRWHYRSRHESLIAFSNYHYYQNRLQTFPSPQAETEAMGVSMRYLPDAEYDRSRTRTNRLEAEAVVAEVVKRLQAADASDEEAGSIGVVTFSMAQQILIEDLLDEARRAHSEIEPFFDSDRLEPVFVKNLENVQGDERATMLFSICYGPDAAGKVTMNFGPLNREGGERRLNVAITRAREQVIVFSSIRADDIDLSRTNRTGVRHLKTFLDYAERGPAAIADAMTLDPDVETDSPFERSIAGALREQGWEVDLHVGCSGYRIDLGVRDPEQPGSYLLGIECDGPFYNSSKTARDRDRIRQSVLAHLGWRLHRVWSRDWWLSPEAETEKIIQALRDAATSAEHTPTEPARIASDAEIAPTLAPDTPEAQASHAQPASDPGDGGGDEFAAMPPGMFFYEPCHQRRWSGDSERFYEDDMRSRVVEHMLAILEAEAPISRDLFTRRLMDLWGLGRMTSRVSRRVDELLEQLAHQGRVTDRSGFLWTAGQDPATYLGFRVPPAEDERPREIDDVPPEELANACVAALRQNISMPAEDVGREVARLFGVTRATDRIQSLIDAGLRHAIARGDAREDGPMIVYVSRQQ